MIGEKQPQDAHKIPAGLRDHLARHDKPIVSFFVTISSCSALVLSGVEGKKTPLAPAVLGLTTICRQDAGASGEEIKNAWIAIKPRCQGNTRDPTVGDVLSCLHMRPADYCTFVRASGVRT